MVIGYTVIRFLYFTCILRLFYDAIALATQARVTIGFLATSLTKAILPRLLSLAVRPARGRVLVIPNFFHLRIMEATVLLGTFNAAEFCCGLPQICASTRLRQFLRPHVLSFALICIVSWKNCPKTNTISHL